MLARHRRGLVAIVSIIPALVASRAHASEDDAIGAPAPALEIAPSLSYGAIRQTRYPFNEARTYHGQAYASYGIGLRYRATSALSLGLVGTHAECDGCAGERFSRVVFEGAFHAIHTRFVDLWGAAEAGFGLSKLAPAQHESCSHYDGSNADGCTPRFSSDQLRTRVGPEAGIGVGVDFLPLSYVSIGVETRLLGVLFDAAPTADATYEQAEAPSGFTPAAFAGLVIAAHIPLPR
jgi:hypothetical protein